MFDGPFAETKEMLAGLYLIDAKDLNEAIQLAAGLPPALHGSVEVRPVRELQRRPESARSVAQPGRQCSCALAITWRSAGRQAGRRSFPKR